MTDLNKALADAVLPIIRTELGVDGALKDEIAAAVASAVEKFTPNVREIVVSAPGREAINVGRQHESFETLVRAVSAGCSVWLTGPAGSGKTVGAEKCAESLALVFSAVSIGPQTTQAHLFGYMDATGTYRGTEVRTRFERGGLLLLDEIDRGNPGVLTALNALLANNVCAFPDGMIARHADFRVVAAANTTGSGADRQYVGALQLDAATLDRFVLIEWSYDAAFERELAGELGGKVGLEWCERVQTLRDAAAALKIRHVISPRATLNGIRLLMAHMTTTQVVEMCVWRGLDAASRDRIMEQAKIAKVETHAETDEQDGGPETPREHGEVCPKCFTSEAVIRSKFDHGTKFVCWKKRGGCGHKWGTV